MEKIIDKLLDFNKLPAKLFFVLGLGCGLVLFLPKPILDKLKINEFNIEYGKYIGIIFLVSIVFLTVSFIYYCNDKIKKWKLGNESKATILNSISNLDSHEKAVLREFYIQDKKAIQMPIDDPTIISMVTKRLIYPLNSTSFIYLHGYYNTFSMPAYTESNISHQIIDLPENPTKEQVIQLYIYRPQWAKERAELDNLLKL